MRKRVQKALWKAGWELRRAHWTRNEFETLTRLLDDRALGSVIDVGANGGEFAGQMIDAGYRGRIVSFEPLPDAHATLAAMAAMHPGWSVAPPMALADHEGEARFFVAGNSVSSSLLPMARLHEDVAPESATTREIKVRVARLDGQAAILPDGPLFLKIDTQGTERAVLDGAAGLLPRIAGLKTELSFAELYEGQSLFLETVNHIAGLGFKLWDITLGLRGLDGRLLQCDAVFVR